MSCRSSRNLLQRVLDRVEGFLGLGAVRPTALRHVRSAAAALPAQGCNRGLDEVDRTHLASEVIGDSYGDAGTTFIDSDERTNAGTETLLHVVNSGPQALGIEAF